MPNKLQANFTVEVDKNKLSKWIEYKWNLYKQPFRKIFEKQSKIIQKICPCFMMSPLSACQYINPEKLKFDFVYLPFNLQVTFNNFYN